MMLNQQVNHQKLEHRDNMLMVSQPSPMTLNERFCQETMEHVTDNNDMSLDDKNTPLFDESEHC